jgi:hypothetical protein
MSWLDQGRQQHGWFGSGTAPPRISDQIEGATNRLFAPTNADRRADYAAYSLIGHVPRDQRGRWTASVSDSARNNLKTGLAVWYGASSLSHDAFRDRFLDP